MAANPDLGETPLPGARQRVLDTAYDLFAQRGVHAVEIEEVIEHADVSMTEFQESFDSKDDLALAFLEQREQTWTIDWLQSESGRRGKTPEEQLLAIFDLFHEWFQRDDYEGCSFVNVLLEAGGASSRPLGRAAAHHLENIRSFISGLAEEAGLRDPEEFAAVYHMLMKGSIVHASEGNRTAARQARVAARLLIDQYS